MNETLVNIFGIYCLFNILSLYLIAPILGANMDEDEESFWKYVFVYQYSTYKSSVNKINTLGIIILETIVTLCTFVSSILIFVGMGILEIFLAICDLFYLIFKKR